MHYGTGKEKVQRQLELTRKPLVQVEEDRCVEKGRVDGIQEPSPARDEGTGILHRSGSFDDRLHQVPHDGGDSHDASEKNRARERKGENSGEKDRTQPHCQDGGKESENETHKTFVGTHHEDVSIVPSEEHSEDPCEGIVHEGGKKEDQNENSPFLEPGESNRIGAENPGVEGHEGIGCHSGQGVGKLQFRFFHDFTSEQAG